MKDIITSAEAPAPAGPYSPGLLAGDLIFLSGQGGFDPETGQLISDEVGEQTAQTFRNIEVLLHAAGATLDDVVSCLVHLADLAQFAEFNASYEKQFPGAVKPVRADLVAGMRVEVTVIAVASHQVSTRSGGVLPAGS
jgi:2-iminobutanoate/2-iminopropanoate deaminase